MWLHEGYGVGGFCGGSSEKEFVEETGADLALIRRNIENCIALEGVGHIRTDHLEARRT